MPPVESDSVLACYLGLFKTGGLMNEKSIHLALRQNNKKALSTWTGLEVSDGMVRMYDQTAFAVVIRRRSLRL